MILFKLNDYYLAFNWNPKIKPESFFCYDNDQRLTLVDFWKFRFVHYKGIENFE